MPPTRGRRPRSRPPTRPRRHRHRDATRPLSGYNRNRRGGPETDPDLTVLRVDTAEGKPLAVLVNWTAHPTFLGSGHMEFSGEWPGHLQRTLETVTLPERRAHPDFMRTGGTEYGLTPATVGPLLDALCPTRTHCTALRIGDLVLVGIPGEMAAGLGLEVKRAARARPGVRHVAIGGLADEWISYMLSPAEYRKGGYEASVSFYGEDLGPTVVDTARRAVASLP